MANEVVAEAASAADGVVVETASTAVEVVAEATSTGPRQILDGRGVPGHFYWQIATFLPCLYLDLGSWPNTISHCSRLGLDLGYLWIMFWLESWVWRECLKYHFMRSSHRLRPSTEIQFLPLS